MNHMLNDKNQILREVKTPTEYYFVDQLGRTQGEYKSWHKNGFKHVSCNYIDDTLHGEFIRWYNDGQVDTIRQYNMGNITGIQIEFHADGILASIAEYNQDGCLHGEYYEWFCNGELEMKASYYNDLEEGEYLEYFVGGLISYHRMCKNNEPDGETISLYSDGSILYHRYVVDGKILFDFEKTPYPSEVDKLVITLTYGGKFLPNRESDGKVLSITDLRSKNV